MSFNGEFYICIKHGEQRFYSPTNQGWICTECEVEKTAEEI
ncbi:MAG: hypothetical protein AABX93_01000 [Nanoarchaeota archaeon]